MTDLGAKEHQDVSATIAACLDLEKPQSFFLYAGAGTGKTRSLADSLNAFRAKYGERLRLRGQRIAVITYTNAACAEITRRIEFDPIVSVSTIHSFVWELIKGFNADIRKWLEKHLASEIGELSEASRKGKPGTKAAVERERSIESKRARLEALPSIRIFSYSPMGDNRTRDSLNHSEVISIGASFLAEKPLMRRLLISGAPFVLIDESQDTNKSLMEALLAVQKEHAAECALGLFGDTMQRIYADGKADLGEALPSGWAKPAKTVNHRSPRRVIRLINQIRSSTDGRTQEPREGAGEGVVRLFVVPSAAPDKQKTESDVRQEMAKITGDEKWKERAEVKTLTLEHHMAARRLGFIELYEPLSAVGEFQDGLRAGNLPLLRFFSGQVLPLVTAYRAGDQFASAAIARAMSPLLQREAFVGVAKQGEQLAKAKAAVVALVNVCDPSKTPTFREVLVSVAKSGLFDIPESLYPFATGGHFDGSVGSGGVGEGGSEPVDERTAAMRKFLDSPFSQIGPYSEYVSESAIFGTHQGVKGLEFPRVVVVVDDEEARGFMFSYEKLFGVVDRSKADIENERSGKETSIDRTRRLFYVTCSRSEESLAIVAYTTNPNRLRQSAIDQKWFEADEIILVPN